MIEYKPMGGGPLGICFCLCSYPLYMTARKKIRTFEGSVLNRLPREMILLICDFLQTPLLSHTCQQVYPCIAVSSRQLVHTCMFEKTSPLFVDVEVDTRTSCCTSSQYIDTSTHPSNSMGWASNPLPPTYARFRATSSGSESCGPAMVGNRGQVSNESRGTTG